MKGFARVCPLKVEGSICATQCNCLSISQKKFLISFNLFPTFCIGSFNNKWLKSQTGDGGFFSFFSFSFSFSQ